MTVVEFEHVSKSYPIYNSPTGRLAELATFGVANRHRDFHALSDVSFSVRRGEVFCIIGQNGSGKSTTLQMVAGIFAPTSGEVRVHGRVSALLELGSGFNPEFTGRENVYMNGAILGFSNKELDRLYSSIEAFAEIGDFINEPVRTYSSGMTVRLAFAVAIHVDPEILIVDEALAVGDAWFRQRCMRRINEMKDRGVTIIFVSHSAADIRAIGDRVMWLDRGRVRMIGETNEVIAKYLACVAGDDAAAETARAQPAVLTRAETIPNVDYRTGDSGAEILGISVLDEFGDPLHLMIPQTRILVRITARANRNLQSPDIGVRLRNHLGLDFAATSAVREGHATGVMISGEIVTMDFRFEIPELYPGAFSFSPWISDNGMTCDSIDNATTVQMARGEGPVYGYVQAPCRVEVQHTESRVV